MEDADQEDTIAYEDEYAEGSIDEDIENEWPARYLLIGIALPVFPWIIMLLLGRWHYLQIRPWLATPLIYSVYSLSFVVVVLYYLFVRRRLELRPLFQYGSAKTLLKELAIAVTLTLALKLAFWIIGDVLMPAFGVEIETPEFWVWMGYGRSSIALLLVLTAGFTIGPVAEELYYRGFAYRALKFRLPIVIALIFQAVFFALVHRFDVPNTIMIFLMGIALALVYEYRKNLLTPVLMHSTNNAIHMIPWIALAITNLHTPAADFSQAAEPPKWLDLSTFEDIERQENGIDQWWHANNTWGDEGSRHWKREVKALEAVSHWFPEDRNACASARLGIVHIYSDCLYDYRRAIVHDRRLLEEYPEQREQCANALMNMGAAYYMLKDFRKSRQAYERVIAEFEEFESPLSAAHLGIQWLDELENVPLAERMHRRLRP